MAVSAELPGAPVADDPTTPENLARYRMKSESQHFDPCDSAAKRSYRCLYRNPKDKDMCSDYFQAYRDCKQKWMDFLRDEKKRLAAERKAG